MRYSCGVDEDIDVFLVGEGSQSPIPRSVFSLFLGGVDSGSEIEEEVDEE